MTSCQTGRRSTCAIIRCKKQLKDIFRGVIQKIQISHQEHLKIRSVFGQNTPFRRYGLNTIPNLNLSQLSSIILLRQRYSRKNILILVLLSNFIFVL